MEGQLNSSASSRSKVNIYAKNSGDIPPDEIKVRGKQGSNGLFLTPPDGRDLLVCQHGARRLAAMDPVTGVRREIASHWDGKRLNGPNDVIARMENGEVVAYFTDPPYALHERGKPGDQPYLDAAVIQQGRLAEQAKALSKDEMLSMIRFGADDVFHASNITNPSDEDIEALIARGEERTKRDEARFENTQNSLANFTLDGEEKTLYEFEGQDFSGAGSERKGPWAISLPKRITKQNYDESLYYRDASKHAEAKQKLGKHRELHDF